MLLSFFLQSKKSISEVLLSYTLPPMPTWYGGGGEWCECVYYSASSANSVFSKVKLYSSRVPGFYIWLLDSFLSAKKNISSLSSSSSPVYQPTQQQERPPPVFPFPLSCGLITALLLGYTYFLLLFQQHSISNNKSLLFN